MNSTKQRSIAIYSIATLLLAIPLIGMQFTKEINWTWQDFLVAGILLFTTAFSIDFILRKIKILGKRFLYISIILIILFLIWAELAIGLFGTPFAGS